MVSGDKTNALFPTTAMETVTVTAMDLEKQARANLGIMTHSQQIVCLD